MAFRVAGVPAVNSWESIFQFQERPWVHASLLDIVDEVGHDAFPLIPQALYPDAKEYVPYAPHTHTHTHAYTFRLTMDTQCGTVPSVRGTLGGESGTC